MECRLHTISFFFGHSGQVNWYLKPDVVHNILGGFFQWNKYIVMWLVWVMLKKWPGQKGFTRAELAGDRNGRIIAELQYQRT